MAIKIKACCGSSVAFSGNQKACCGFQQEFSVYRTMKLEAQVKKPQIKVK